MSPRAAGQSVASWWGALSDASKALVAAAGTVGVIATAVVTLSGWLSLPGRVETLEAQGAAQHAKDAAQDSAIAANRRGVDVLGSQMELQTCSSLARAHANGKTADECVGEYLSRVRSQP